MKKHIIFFTSLLFVLSCNKNENNVQLVPVDKEPEFHKRNIIFFIGDGMGLAHISGARTINGGHLNLLNCSFTGLQSTHAADEYITDSGASTTAMACGQKTNYGSVGVDSNGNPLTSILEIADNKGLSTGLISTASITHATPAAFYAHQNDRYQYEKIALDLMQKDVDFFLGGGRKFFDSRSDNLNLIDTLVRKGYQVVESLDQINGDKKVAVFTNDNHPPSYANGRGDILPNAVETGINRLKANENGFFLMVEGAQIDWGAEENDENYMMDEMFDFDNAIGVALDFAVADGNTLVVVTGDHETGGYVVLDGNIASNTVQGTFATEEHTGSMVPVFASGPGAEYFTGAYENTEIYSKFMSYYGFKE